MGHEGIGRSSTNNSLGCDYHRPWNCGTLHLGQLRLALPLLCDLRRRHRRVAVAHWPASGDSLDSVEGNARYVNNYGSRLRAFLIVLIPCTAGKSEEKLPPGVSRPELDYRRYGSRTLWTNIGMFHYGFEWGNAGKSMLDTLRSTFFPAVVWSILANSIFLITNQAAQQLGSFALLAQG